MITDVHVHLVGMREEDGCYVDPDLLSGLLFRYLMHSLGLSEVPEGRRSRAYREQLVAWVDESDIEAVGLLALDGIYDDGGRLDRERTKFVVSNDYCLEVAGDHDALVPICSVHPGRSDAIEELERVVRRGAAAIKLLPNSQDIDYCDDRFRPFWQRMARLGVPLLTHTSFEHTIPPVDQSLGHPERLEPVLDEGVTVIAAHCGSSGVGHWTEHYPVWREMLRTYPNLYGDISAMTSVSRFRYVDRILDDELASERVLLGSDFPIPCNPRLFIPQVGWERASELAAIDNPLQRNLETFRALGVGQSILRRGSRVLRI